MTRTLLIWLAAASLLAWGGCCPPCDQTPLGDFALLDDSRTWLAFADGEPQLYELTDGSTRTVLLSDEPLITQTVERLENCEDQGNCGLCCDRFTVEQGVVQQPAATTALRFEYLLEKDFITNDILDVSGTVSDMLVITLNGQIRLEILDVPNASGRTNVRLGGREYTGLFVGEIDPAQADVLTDGIFRFYFQPGLGIVGWEETNGQVWSLRT